MYYLFSQDLDRYLLHEQLWNVFDIYRAAKEHLNLNKEDTIELRFINNKQNKIIGFFENNPINGKPSRVILKGTKTFYKCI